MEKHFYLIGGQWHFHSYCGDDYSYDPVLHLVVHTFWVYGAHDDYLKDSIILPQNIDYKTDLGMSFRNLMEILNSIHP